MLPDLTRGITKASVAGHVKAQKNQYVVLQLCTLLPRVCCRLLS